MMNKTFYKKTLIAVGLILFISKGLTAQTPTQAELEKMMKQANEAKKNIDPETKKMMDSLGIKLPGTTTVPKVGDKALAEAYEEQTRIIPKKDAARITQAQQVLTNPAVPAFIAKTHSAVAVMLPAKIKSDAEEVYQSVKTKSNNPIATANAATGLWMNGNYSLAVYIMGKACMDDPANTDNLNNYAAFLTMTGAEQAALPILMNLNKRFPKNSTILNNIGQAWFGLGDIAKAEKYLDSAILLYAVHSQANFTKCLIQESKGSKTTAIDAVKKSLKNSYSNEKISKLNDLGYEINEKDIDWDFRIPVDALGLEKFHLPKYPMNTDEVLQYEENWKAFRNECREKRKILDAKNEKLYPEQEQQALDEQKRLLAAVSNRQRIGSTKLVPFYHPKAVKKLIYMVDDKDGSIQYKRNKVMEIQKITQEKVTQLEEQMAAELEKTMKDVFVTTINGDGGVTEEQYCNMYNGIVNKYLPQANMALFKARVEQLEFERKQINNQAYFNMFTTDPLTFEIYKNGAKAAWLEKLAGTEVKFWGCPIKTSKAKQIEQTGNVLPDFDDIHCDRHVEFYFYSTTLRLDCSRLTSEIDLPFLKASIKENLNTNEIIRGSVEVGIDKKLEISKGPLKGEVKAEVSVGIEFDKSGITDVVLKGGAKAEVGASVINEGPKGNETQTLWMSEPSVTIGSVEGRYSWNSGGSLQGKGIFKGLKL